MNLKTLLVLLVASWLFTMWGYLWYATLLDDVWQDLIQKTEQELIDMAVQRGPIQTVFTYLISFVQSLGIFCLLKLVRAKTFIEYTAVTLIISVLIATPVLGNAVLFAGTPTGLWLVDLLHFVLGYAGIGLVFWIFFEVLGAKPRQVSQSKHDDDVEQS